MSEKKEELSIILDFVKRNVRNMSDNNREFLIRYSASKAKLNPEESYSVDKNNFLNDLKVLTDSYSNCNNTALTAKRMSKIIELIKSVNFDMGENELDDLSLELDELYIESGLPVRNTDTVLKKIRVRDKDEERIRHGR